MKFAESGELYATHGNEDNQPIMQQYGAQIDALIRLNVKDINTNSSTSVIQSIKLFNKFFKLMHNVDGGMVKKLFAMLASGVQQPLKCNYLFIV